MNFTYEYRDKTGSRQTGVIDAADRADCFAKLKAQGISPLNVREGGKAAPTPTAKKASSGASPRVMRGIIAGALVVVAVVVALQFLWPKESKPVEPAPKPSPKVETPKPATPKPEPKKTLTREQRVAATTNQVPKLEQPKTPWTNVYTNNRGEEVRVEKSGSKITMLKGWQKKREQEKLHPVKRVFRHETEAYMALFLNPAQAVPPPPDNYTDEQVAQMLANKIEILPDDTEDEIRQKKGVIQFKEELAEYIKNGGTFNQYLAALEKRQNAEAGKMFEARKMISEAIEKGNVEEAKELYDAINKHFAEQSMPPVNVAPKYRKLLSAKKETSQQK